MYGIYKMEAEWDSNLTESLYDWIRKAGVDAEKMISRHGTIDEAKAALKLLDDKWAHYEYGDGRIYVRWYEIKVIDS